MTLACSFKFLDDDLNRKLIALVKRIGIEHNIDAAGVLHYSPDDQDLVENDLLQSIRNEVFPSWQVLTCPQEWTERYKGYMDGHAIPYRQELANNQLWFLLPRKYRPHSWRLRDQSCASQSSHR